MYFRYTSQITFNDSNYIQSSSNDLSKLILHTVIILDCHQGTLKGTILDNQTGEIVHRCNRLQ